MSTAKPIDKTMQYVRRKGIVRPRDLEALCIPREYLLRLYRQGKLSRTGRGIYTLPDAAVTERHSYAEVSKRVPESILCLLSALAFHEFKDSLRQKKATINDIYRYAKICRVSNVIRPYMEAL